MNVEEEHLDVLQNIEFAIVNTYRLHPNLVDFDVETVLNELIRTYQAEQNNRTYTARLPTELTQMLYPAVKSMCDWRLGRSELSAGGPTPQVPPVSHEVMIACLKRIRKSVQTWNKRGGRRGYLSFVQEYVR
jgi:hypothetical protein